MVQKTSPKTKLFCFDGNYREDLNHGKLEKEALYSDGLVLHM